MDIKEFNQSIIDEFRANEGVVGGPFEGAKLLLLTTVGAKTGAERINPLATIEDDGRLFIIASFAGADNNPPWYHNLVANPQVTVEVGTEKYSATAAVVDEPERTRLYEKMEASMAAFTEYKNKTDRVIPVIALTRN